MNQRFDPDPAFILLSLQRETSKKSLFFRLKKLLSGLIHQGEIAYFLRFDRHIANRLNGLNAIYPLSTLISTT